MVFNNSICMVVLLIIRGRYLNKYSSIFLELIYKPEMIYEVMLLCDATEFIISLTNSNFMNS